ncbi:MAG: hypothetical protein HY700_02130 [Gemmatimonadetes bacterium]|nr:hypothetical protein [Gemmatimonadota bacterium]
MSALTWSGAIGLGLVWGWWTAPLAEHPPRWPAALLIVSVAVLQTLESVWLTGPTSASVLLGSWLFGFVLHRGFRTALRMRSSERATS